MSHHILHILKHGSILLKERGFIICKTGDELTGRMPVEDIRAVVIAARGVTLSSSFISALLSSDSVILHCDESYKPCGISAGYPKTTDSRAAYAQARNDLKIHGLLWKAVLKAKIENQAFVIRQTGGNPAYLEREAKKPDASESNCARYYWKEFFSAAEMPSERRKPRSKTPANSMLNYGYAVISSLVHRGIIIHGLNPLFGIHHKSRAKAHPLVYDLMEPLRPFIDLAMFKFIMQQESDLSIKAWSKFLASELVSVKIKKEKFSLKLIDAVDSYSSSASSCFSSKSVKKLWVPLMRK